MKYTSVLVNPRLDYRRHPEPSTDTPQVIRHLYSVCYGGCFSLQAALWILSESAWLALFQWECPFCVVNMLTPLARMGSVVLERQWDIGSLIIYLSWKALLETEAIVHDCPRSSASCQEPIYYPHRYPMESTNNQTIETIRGHTFDRASSDIVDAVYLFLFVWQCSAHTVRTFFLNSAVWIILRSRTASGAEKSFRRTDSKATCIRSPRILFHVDIGWTYGNSDFFNSWCSLMLWPYNP